MNRKFLFILSLSVVSLVFGSCLKSGSDYQSSGNNTNCVPNNTGVPTAAEIASLQNYLTAHSISAIQDPQGFFYIIVNPGTGATPILSSTVTVKYTGYLENGFVFDQNLNGTSFTLSQLILGWQKGLPLIKKGGTIKLYLPPSLGYGCNSVGLVPPGSNLVFNIDLVDVQ